MRENSAIRKYIRTETAISVIINSILSGLFTWAAFSRQSAASVWGSGGVAFDFFPQTFMITLMSVLVPTMVTRKRMRDGRITPSAPPSSQLPGNVMVRALLVAAMGMVAFGSLAVATLYMLGIEAVRFQVLLPGKIAYGALVALLVTPPALRAALRDQVA